MNFWRHFLVWTRHLHGDLASEPQNRNGVSTSAWDTTRRLAGQLEPADTREGRHIARYGLLMGFAL